ncbi:uncharacterized protein [Rutidosis leptorrhynchoides]|uniref:uncharacterized protein n=1 Tax=Rutidosis leptorrhynchoides TaxID=125765 RepID=UPI003A990402
MGTSIPAQIRTMKDGITNHILGREINPLLLANLIFKDHKYHRHQINGRQPGTLPGNTEANPRDDKPEQYNAISLCSGKEVSYPPVLNTNNGKDVLQEQMTPEKESDEQVQSEKEKVVEKPVRQAVPPVPYPARLQKSKEDGKFKKFLNLLRQVHVNIPLIDVIEQMPKYAKFLMDMISKKRKFLDNEEISLNENCSAIVQNTLLPKLKDPSSFTIPCKIGNLSFKRSFCDLRASINLMPLSVFKKLGMGKCKLITITLQLDDRSITRTEEILEDVLVQEADQNVPLILGRPFLATNSAKINVAEGDITIRWNNEKIVFNIFKAMTYSRQSEECSKVNVIDHAVRGKFFATSKQEAPDIELQPLPKHLKYTFLDKSETLPIIISAKLTPLLEFKLLKILREREEAIKKLNLALGDVGVKRLLQLTTLEEFCD